MTRLLWIGVGIFIAFAIAYCSIKTAKPRASAATSMSQGTLTDGQSKKMAPAPPQHLIT